MGFWNSLFGRSDQPAAPAVNALERVATEETQRRRLALEQGPRATAKQLDEVVEGLHSKSQLSRAYNSLRHFDFCDAVAEAVRRGNFSDEDATHALYLREWVSSGAAFQTTFPEWMERAGIAHIMRLNGEWLKSGEKRLTFNEWLVGGKAASSPVEVPVAPAQTKAWGHDWSTSGSLPKDGRWRQEDNRLVCDHNVIAVVPSQTLTSLRIVCSVSRYLSGTVATNLSFELSPYLHLMKEGAPFEPHLVEAPFALGLVADGTGRGTQRDPLVQGGLFKVSACGSEDEPETAFLQIVSDEDIASAIRTLGIGRKLTLTLMDYEAEPPVKLRLRLEGDPSFSRLYESLRSSA